MATPAQKKLKTSVKIYWMIFHHFLLVLTLQIVNSEMGCGTCLYQLSSDLVFALAFSRDLFELWCWNITKLPTIILTACGNYYISQQSYVYTHRKCDLNFPRPHVFLELIRCLRKARKLYRWKKHVKFARSRYIIRIKYTGYKFDGTLDYPGCWSV